MEILDKYKDIITRIEEMCTSTAAMAPYPVGGVSVTTVSGKQRKGKSKKAMLNYKYTKQWSEKNMDITETMKEIAALCEAMISEEGIGDKIKTGVKKFLGLEKDHHPSYNTNIAKDLRAQRDNMDKISDEADTFHARAERATGHRKEVNQQYAMDKERAYREANKKLRGAKGEVLDYFRSKGDSNPQAHDKLNKMMESIIDMCTEIIGEKQ